MGHKNRSNIHHTQQKIAVPVIVTAMEMIPRDEYAFYKFCPIEGIICTECCTSIRWGCRRSRYWSVTKHEKQHRKDQQLPVLNDDERQQVVKCFKEYIIYEVRSLLSLNIRDIEKVFLRYVVIGPQKYVWCSQCDMLFTSRYSHKNHWSLCKELRNGYISKQWMVPPIGAKNCLIILHLVNLTNGVFVFFKKLGMIQN